MNLKRVLLAGNFWIKVSEVAAEDLKQRKSGYFLALCHLQNGIAAEHYINVAQVCLIEA